MSSRWNFDFIYYGKEVVSNSGCFIRLLSAILNFGHVTWTGRLFFVTGVCVEYETMEFNTNRTVLAPNYVQLHHMIAMH